MRDCAGRPTWCSDCTVPSICRCPGSSNHRIRFAAHAPQGALSSTDEPWENRGEGRAATSITRPMLGKAAGLPAQWKSSPRPNRAQRRVPARLDHACKLQRTLSEWPSYNRRGSPARLAVHAAGRRWSESWMREIRVSSSMRGRRKRAAAQHACALLYRSPCLD
jgi:hypothetical protein